MRLSYYTVSYKYIYNGQKGGDRSVGLESALENSCSLSSEDEKRENFVHVYDDIGEQ